MNRNSKLVLLIVVVLLACAQLACISNDSVLKIKSDYENNVVATTVPIVGTMQQGAEKLNGTVEQVVVPATGKVINDAKQQVGNSTAAQAANNSTQALCQMYKCDSDGDVMINPVTGAKVLK